MNGITNAVFVASSIPIWPIRSIGRFPQNPFLANDTYSPWPYAEHTPNFADMPKHPQLVAIGAQIRELRSREGYSQEEFAAEVGMDRAYFGGVERGERNVAALNLVRIAAGLRVEVGELFPSVSSLRKLR